MTADDGPQRTIYEESERERMFKSEGRETDKDKCARDKILETLI